MFEMYRRSYCKLLAPHLKILARLLLTKIVLQAFNGSQKTTTDVETKRRNDNLTPLTFNDMALQPLLTSWKD